MNKKRILFTFLSVCVFALMLAVTGSAKGMTELYIDGYSSTEAVEKVAWSNQNTDGKYYLYVPTTADKENLAVFFNGASEVTVNGTAIQNGEKTNVFAKEGTYTVTADGVSTAVTVKHTAQPSVIITTESGSLDYIHAKKGNKETGTMLLADSEKVQFNGALSSIKGRGNSTWVLPKKPYNIKLDKKTNLFDMGKSKNWCLLANYYDKTFFRNEVALNLADRIGMPFNSKMVSVNLFINGQYLGLYSLCEKVEIGDNRIEINDLEGATETANGVDDLEVFKQAGDVKSNKPNTYKYVDIPNNPADITGGYLLEVDTPGRYVPEVSGFVTSRGIPVVVKEPEFASKAQVEYIRAYFQGFEDALFSETGYNAQGKHYSEYCDMTSLAKAYIVNDFTVNVDAGYSSFYFYKDTDSIMQCGPMWDFDLAMANWGKRDSYDLNDPKTTYVREKQLSDINNCDSYFNAMYDHADFEEAVLTCWADEVKPVLPGIYELAESKKNLVFGDAISDYILWNQFETTDESALVSNYNGQTAKVINFLKDREAFLDDYYAQSHVDVPQAGKPASSGSLLDLIRSFFQAIINFFKNIFKF